MGRRFRKSGGQTRYRKLGIFACTAEKVKRGFKNGPFGMRNAVLKSDNIRFRYVKAISDTRCKTYPFRQRIFVILPLSLPNSHWFYLFGGTGKNTHLAVPGDLLWP